MHSHAIAPGQPVYGYMQGRGASSRRFKMGTCQLREKPFQKNIDPPGLLGVGVGLTTQPRKMICR
jgi:hypothetical protein